MADQKYILRTLLRFIETLLKGPYTMKEIADITGLPIRTCYGYVKTISEVLPVQSVRRKRNIKGKGLTPKHFWLES